MSSYGILFVPGLGLEDDSEVVRSVIEGVVERDFGFLEWFLAGRDNARCFAYQKIARKKFRRFANNEVTEIDRTLAGDICYLW